MMHLFQIFCVTASAVFTAAVFTGCASGAITATGLSAGSSSVGVSASSSSNGSGDISSSSVSSSAAQGTRDSTPRVLVPEASGVQTQGTDTVTIDTGNISQGYVMVKYGGNDADPKILIAMPDGSNYYYHLHNTGDYETFPLTAGNGSYTITILKNILDDQYALEYSESVDVTIENPLTPYLYPNQYVNFNADSAAVKKGQELAYSANDDLSVIGNVYSYVSGTIKYDYSEAETVQAGYTPDPDVTLGTGKGICFDFAALMATMLRTQGIPTRLEVGYAGTVYHAWVSCYVEEIGWVNGIIEFDGKDWTMMDPTFAAAKGEKGVQDYIGDGSNYQTKYIY